jgi:transcriptional regulator GlxA family with amidase domain
MDEAKGMALTFIAVVSAAMLELETTKPLHQLQLKAARVLDRSESGEEIVKHTLKFIQEAIGDALPDPHGSNDVLVQRALAYVERHFAEDLSDASVAGKLGLSTSHFRYLFKQQVRQPFHKYVVALRLERARDMLVQHNLMVGIVAERVGFASPAHFTRAFSKRFGVAPSAYRSQRA